jgi:hypothetical protein
MKYLFTLSKKILDTNKNMTILIKGGERKESKNNCVILLTNKDRKEVWNV